MSIIYKITNLTNGMVYIGRSNKSLEDAMVAHRYEGKQTNPRRLIGQAIKQFGIDSFTYETVEECATDELRARHKYWMEHFQSQGENGYNRKHQGKNAVSHDEIMVMHHNGMSAEEIANILQCDERTVVNHVKADSPDADIKTITKRHGRQSSKDNILQLWETGMTHIEIAEQLHLTSNFVKLTLRQNNVTTKELYERQGLPLPAQCRRYEYAQVNEQEETMETPDRSSIIADRHDISYTSLYDACTGPRTHTKGKMFRRYNEDGEMVPRMYEPVGHALPVTCTSAENPELVQEFPSLTAAVVALTGTKDMNVMCQLRTAIAKHHVFQGMYWSAEERDNRRRPIYAFSVNDYNVQHVFMTQGEASIALRVHTSQITKHLNYPQKYRSAGGYICTWNKNFSREEWEEARKFARPENARCKANQIKKQSIYLTGIETYDVTYCSTLLDAQAKTKSSVAVIYKCLRGEAKSTKQYFVSDRPLTFEEWNERVANLNTNTKSVYGIHLVTKEVITATSIGEAAQKVSLSRQTLSHALRNNRIAAGYQWHYGVPQIA